MPFRTLLGVAALTTALAGSSLPAAAEFFGCHDRPGQVLAVYNGAPADYVRHLRRVGPRYTHAYSAHAYRHRVRRHYTKPAWASR